MAKPIEATPTLYGEDAKRVQEDIKNVASSEEIERRIRQAKAELRRMMGIDQRVMSYEDWCSSLRSSPNTPTVLPGTRLEVRQIADVVTSGDLFTLLKEHPYLTGYDIIYSVRWAVVLNHDTEADVLYVRTPRTKYIHNSESLPDDDSVIVNNTVDGRIVGLQLLDASKMTQERWWTFRSDLPEELHERVAQWIYIRNTSSNL